MYEKNEVIANTKVEVKKVPDIEDLKILSNALLIFMIEMILHSVYITEIFRYR